MLGDVYIRSSPRPLAELEKKLTKREKWVEEEGLEAEWDLERWTRIFAIHLLF